MSLAFKTLINWTTSAIALGLLCGVFCFGASAQDGSNKPLDAEAASALVQELTDGLPDLIEDEAQVTAITEKWEERRDLAGKNREQILKVLQADVRSVVNDPKLLDSIWKAWTAGADSDEQETDKVEQVKTPPKPATPERKEPAPVPSPRIPFTLFGTNIPRTRTPPVEWTRTDIPEPTIKQQFGWTGYCGSEIDPCTIQGAYFAEMYQTPICVRPPGFRFTNKACIEADALKIPRGSPPEYLCERIEGKGNCVAYKGYGNTNISTEGWTAKTCKYGYHHFTWSKWKEGGENAGNPVLIGDFLICTSGKQDLMGWPGIHPYRTSDAW